MTTRIYYSEPWCREFDARVTDACPRDARTSVYLDRTAFYPTSGGQPHDMGTLGGVPLVEVLDEDDGRVAHVVDGALAVGQAVHGAIAWPRRFDHMQQHTGQHLLSAAFDRLFEVRTESFHLGSDVSTIDLARAVSAGEVAAAETLSNQVVWEDRPVGIRFVTDEEASRLPFRKPPVKEGRIRVIEIEEFDLSACGGTHVSRTGEVGIVGVRSWEKYKGGMRVEFVCGGRALDAYRTFRDAVTGSIRALSVLPGELADGIAKLQTANKDAQREIKTLRERLGAFDGRALADGAETIGGLKVVVAAVDGYDAATIKPVVVAASSQPGGVAVLFSTGSPRVVAAARDASAAHVDCGALVRALTERFGGKGGGRPELAQGGGMQAEVEDLVAFAKTWIVARR
jgi:alanyl-tRNA synthetase